MSQNFANDPDTGVFSNLASVLHASEASISIEGNLVGSIQELTFAMNGTEEFFNVVGTSFPITHRVSGFEPKGTFKLGTVDLSELALVGALRDTIPNTETDKDIKFFAYNGASTWNPKAFPLSDATDDIFPYVFVIEIIFTSASNNVAKITIYNCEVSNATPVVRNNEFILTDVEFIFTHYRVQQVDATGGFAT